MKNTIINTSAEAFKKNGSCLIMCDQLICENSHIVCRSKEEKTNVNQGFIAICSKNKEEDELPKMQVECYIHDQFINPRLIGIETMDMIDLIRYSWRKGSLCKIFSKDAREKFEGKIVEISTRLKNGERLEWLKVIFDDGERIKSKWIQRLCKDIEPIDKELHYNSLGEDMDWGDRFIEQCGAWENYCGINLPLDETTDSETSSDELKKDQSPQVDEYKMGYHRRIISHNV